MRFYRLPDTIRASIQGVGVWIQIGATVYGIAPNWWWDYKDPRQRNKRVKRFGIVMGAPPEFCGTRALFMLEIGRKEFGYRSRGELDRNDCRYRDTGWKFAK